MKLLWMLRSWGSSFFLYCPGYSQNTSKSPNKPLYCKLPMHSGIRRLHCIVCQLGKVLQLTYSLLLSSIDFKVAKKHLSDYFADPREINLFSSASIGKCERTWKASLGVCNFRAKFVCFGSRCCTYRCVLRTPTLSVNITMQLYPVWKVLAFHFHEDDEITVVLAFLRWGWKETKESRMITVKI